MSRSQRICNSLRKQTQQIRHILMQGSTYYKIQHVPVEKVVLGNADPTRWPATLHSYLKHLMPDTLSRNIYRALFSDDQWDLIYAMAGHALDNDDFTPEDVYSIRNKIHSLFDYNDWYLQLHWRWGDSSRTDRCHLYRHHYCYCFSSLLFFSYEEIKI